MACKCKGCSAVEAGGDETSESYEAAEPGQSEEDERDRRFAVIAPRELRRIRRRGGAATGARLIVQRGGRPLARPPVLPGFGAAFRQAMAARPGSQFVLPMRAAFAATPFAGRFATALPGTAAPFAGGFAMPLRTAAAAVQPVFSFDPSRRDRRRRRRFRRFQLLRSMPARFDLDGDALDLDPAAAPPTAPDDAADPAFDVPGLDAGDPGAGAGAAPQTEAEADDGDPAYVRWVQRALNQVAGLRLGTDGVAGTQTRSAIRAFQARRGLPVDGIANPATRDALVQAGAPPPAGSPVPSRDPHLRAAIARWNLPTGLPDAPTFHELVERWRPRHIPLALLVAFSSLEASGWTDATHGTPGNGYTSPDFFELGMFQTPAGRHGTCTSGRYADCEFAPPGSDPRGGSPWFQIARQLGLDPARWTDRTIQVRIGLANLERDAAKVRGRFPELFPDKASDWAIRAAVLLPFGPGIGYTIGLLAKHRAALAKLPESERWAMLQRTGARTKNSDDKMVLARELADAMGVASTMPPVAGELGPLFR